MGVKKLNLKKETLLTLEGDAASAVGAGTKYCGFTNTCAASKGNNTCNCFYTITCAVGCSISLPSGI